MESDDLEEYRRWLDNIYGFITIREVTLRASEIYEQLYPWCFEQGQLEFLEVKRQEELDDYYLPR